MGMLMQKIAATVYRRYFAARVDSEIRNFLLHRSVIFGGDEGRVKIAPTAQVNNALFNVASGNITIGNYVFFGHNVCLLTGTHDPALRGHDRQWTWPTEGRDIVIKEGVWLASNVTIIGPVTIGEHAVVAAGSLVSKDIPPDVIAAGSPAKVIRKIDYDNKA